MQIKITGLILFLLLSPATIHAESVVTLKDGSQIKGEVIGLSDGVYTLKTPIIGEVHVAIADVVNINNGTAMPQAAALPSASTENLNQQVKSAQAQLMSNPQTMIELQEMLKDPEIAQLLSNPELVRIVTSNDVNAIAENPQAQALMNNPKMRAFIQKIQGSSAAQ